MTALDPFFLALPFTLLSRHGDLRVGLSPLGPSGGAQESDDKLSEWAKKGRMIRKL